MQAKNLIVLLIFLFSSSLKAQGEVDVKIDLYPLIIGKGIQLSVEKKLSKKWGIDLSAFYFGQKHSLSFIDSLTGRFINEDFKSRRFSSTLSMNFYPFPKKEKGLDFYFGPTARMTWVTYVDPDYYEASEVITGFRPGDFMDNNPNLDVGIVIGFDTEIFDNIILEPSMGSIFGLSNLIRSKKIGSSIFSFEGWLSIRLAYRFRKGD